ncbi:hypothetical protein VHP8226_03101 [Vibrio hippocampi]|uniref:Uncharacterized protein n=1 Tax=Vibrio hippocampi TaxID=654686 RepID=A0ABM8ZLG6_9VIBR|nr:hypothetical protein VHP8226_03101 [Vibrio hippocampi]
MQLKDKDMCVESFLWWFLTIEFLFDTETGDSYLVHIEVYSGLQKTSFKFYLLDEYLKNQPL